MSDTEEPTEEVVVDQVDGPIIDDSIQFIDSGESSSVVPLQGGFIPEFGNQGYDPDDYSFSKYFISLNS